MDDNLLILNAQVPGFQGLQQICIQKGVIHEIVPIQSAPQTDLPVLDVSGDWISLGGIDLQINGALGLAFPDLSVENCDKLEAICQYLWSQGVDGFLPTIVTTSIENIQRSLSTISQFLPSTLNPQDASQILGVHLEGPFLNFEKRGAHPANYLLPLTVEQIKRVLGDYASVVKVITLAPELDPTGTAIAYLRSLGIIVSLGHSQATATQAQQAFAQGATQVTHAFNAMPSLHHREPGLLGAAIADPNVHCGLIADGQHVSPLMLELVLKASQFHGIFLVSDALSPLGLPDGTYPWDTRQIDVQNGTARLLDKTLAGTTLPLLVGAQNLVKWGICGVEQAIALATTAPRRAIAQSESYLNQPAHLLRWHLHSTTGDLSWQRL
ncbi:N-acetylglucosamine-6-phosphate deacetylase [Phormidesmis priestleyi ULC007]|uniref:N-acetylglucosamine-6-phosphate deacetylase n=1 Tax=Phormidesmis priestleyi ULC007 TaxID=1920490 RepID=A0A2T1DP52_9CYAN|nr:N-acetylglucosamine-6-phosphate deacetylase [Phormidesmis priestleyi]PSB22231.1 N-acetylglucosamine-6-phosphate deacetylase [Phormidesmis priestleyi ULC007]PZO52508.1 MAG: N-acetylglucosamine-6-phosphate deacetylase [Phormidesmis priestleyi]